jgi:cytochrome c assembly protein
MSADRNHCITKQIELRLSDAAPTFCVDLSTVCDKSLFTLAAAIQLCGRNPKYRSPGPGFSASQAIFGNVLASRLVREPRCEAGCGRSAEKLNAGLSHGWPDALVWKYRMSHIGSFALLMALALCGYSLLGGIAALIRKGPWLERLGETARRAGIVTFGAIVVVLVMAALSDDFSIAYIFHHSNRELATAYKFATLWSGQEGSLPFWSLLLAGYGLVLRFQYKIDDRLFAYASVVIAAVQMFFLLRINFKAHPFAIMKGQLPANGEGLNPLLQYPEMVIHPHHAVLGLRGFHCPVRPARLAECRLKRCTRNAASIRRASNHRPCRRFTRILRIRLW